MDATRDLTVSYHSFVLTIARSAISRLLEAHELILGEIREAITKTAANRDDGTNDLLMSEGLRTNELQIWFLAEHLATDDSAYVPFGGVKLSGNGGRYGSYVNWDEYTQWRWFTISEQPTLVSFFGH